MERFYEYIEKSLPDKNNDRILYKFKKETLDSMTARANELTARGLKDNDVISDLIISEYKDIVNVYKAYAVEKRKKERKRRFAIANVIGCVIYVLMLLIVFLGLSFSTGAWGTTWVIMVDGILLLISYLLTLGISRILEMKRVFHILARILLAINIVVISVAVFIFMMAVLHIPHSWVIVFGGLLAMFVADATFASATKQKLAIINWLAYIPAMSAMIFVIIGALSIVKWSVAWVIIPLSLVLDLIIMLISISRNNRYDEEVIDTWKEN